MEKEASFSISIQEGKVEISGSEAFVREQIENFKELILETTKRLQTAQQQIPPPPPPPGGGVGPRIVLGTNQYPNVIAIHDDQIKILKPIPGKKKAEKTVNAALLYLVGKGIKGEETALFEEIRMVCKDHACLDAANFAATLKGAKEYLIVGGSGKKQTAKLSHPGCTKAQELASELNGS
jgi:hypothetical protein